MVMSGYIWLGLVSSDYFRLARLCQVRSGYIWLGQVGSGYLRLDQARKV
jgi:hypothetical protein